MTSFDKELQVQKDIAAREKQKLALLQVKKESYINYLKNKGNTPWIPGGDGAKHQASLHKSINKSATEQRMLQRAWCRSPWPGQVPKNMERPAGDTDSRDDEQSFNLQGQNFQWHDPRFSVSLDEPTWAGSTPIPLRTSPLKIATTGFESRSRARPSSSPQRVSAFRNECTQGTAPLPSTATPAMSNRLVRSSADSVSSAPTTSAGTRSARKQAATASNSKYVALTVRLIDTAHPAQKSAYGVFIVPRHCTRLEMIGNIERQFNVPGQVSDISITYRTGYSHSAVVKSLSMGTIADVPEVSDYSSITIYLNGSTIFDSHGNITANPAVVHAGANAHHEDRISPSGEIIPMSTVLPSSREEMEADASTVSSQGAPPSSSLPSPAARVTSPEGLAAGDNLLFFDDGSVDPVSTTHSVMSRSMSSQSGLRRSPPKPVQVPLYEALHPDQPMHGFSYASPKRPLLDMGDLGAPLSGPVRLGQRGAFSEKGSRLGSSRASADARSSAPVDSYVNGSYASLLPDDLATDGQYLPSNPAASSIVSRNADRGRTTASSQRGPTAAPPQQLFSTSATNYLFDYSAGQYVEHAPVERPVQQHFRRDWLAEAEAQLQGEQDRPVRAPEPATDPTTLQHPAASLDIASPPYRWGTASSLNRRRGQPENTKPISRDQRLNSRPSRQQSASIEQMETHSRASSRSSRTRSRSVDASSRGTSVTRWSRGHSKPPLSPAPVSIRSTASSRGRSAFINSRAGEFNDIQQHAPSLSPSHSRRRSNSVGRDSRQKSYNRHNYSDQVIHDAPQDQWYGEPQYFQQEDEQFRVRVPSYALEEVGSNGEAGAMPEHNPYFARPDGLYMGGRVISRSSEGLDHYNSGAEEDQYDIMQLGSGSGAVGIELTPREDEEMRAAYNSQQQPSEQQRMQQGRSVQPAASYLVPDRARAGSSSTIASNSSGGGTGNGQRMGGKQLSMNLEELLADIQ